MKCIIIIYDAYNQARQRENEGNIWSRSFAANVFWHIMLIIVIINVSISLSIYDICKNPLSDLFYFSFVKCMTPLVLEKTCNMVLLFEPTGGFGIIKMIIVLLLHAPPSIIVNQEDTRLSSFYLLYSL